MGKYVDFLSFRVIFLRNFLLIMFFILSIFFLTPPFKACGFPHLVYIQNFFPLATEYFSIFAVVLQLSVQDKKSGKKRKCKIFHLLQSQPSQLLPCTLSEECDIKSSKQFDTHGK